MTKNDYMDIMTNSTDREERKTKMTKDKKKKNKKRKRDHEMKDQYLSSTDGTPTCLNEVKDSKEKKERIKKEKKFKKAKKHKKNKDGSDLGNVNGDRENMEAIMKRRQQEGEYRALVGDMSRMTSTSIPGRAVVESSAIEYYDPTVVQNLASGKRRKCPLSNDDVNNSVVSRQCDYSLTLLLFYQYVEPVWDEPTYEYILATLQKVGKDLELTGRMRVAREGLNCTLTASYSSILEYCNTLRRLRPEEFQDTEFKVTRNLPVAQKFPNLKVLKVVELVHYGLEGDKAPPINKYHGTHLEPKEYHKKLAEPNTVIIDVVSVMKNSCQS
jgi:membrane-associated HD superfamily phosphohydrolase